MQFVPAKMQRLRIFDWQCACGASQRAGMDLAPHITPVSPLHSLEFQMANRNQDNYQTGSRRYSQDWREDDDNNEGQGQFGRSRDNDEQSGSTGRYAGYGDFGRGEYGGGRSGWSGQERYGQSGYGQGGYGRSGSEGGDYRQGRSGQGNYGQGRSGSGDYGYGGGGMQRSRSGGQRNYRTESGYGGSRGWSEPYDEGQQYTSSGEYGGRGTEEWGGGSQGYGGMQGSQGYGSRGVGGSQSYVSQGYGSQGYGSQGFGQRGMGQHHGKGPKGYQRSDERTKELLCERLRDDPEIDPSEVTITVQGGKITLEGTVDSRQTKNAIEEIADQFGTQDVQNNLRIQRQGQQTGESQGRQAKSATSGDDNTTTKKHN
jgi:osmotically-inducible protein OsmY